MNDVILISGYSIYTLGLVSVFSFLWGSYVFFKKAREAHFDDSTLLDIVVVGAFWSFIVGRIFYIFLNMATFWNRWSRVLLLSSYPGVNHWGSIVGILIGGYFIVRKKKDKYIDLIDLMSLGLLSGASVFWMGLNFIRLSWQNIFLSVLYLLMFVFMWQVESTYRFISWYRGSKNSARSGFVSGITLSFVGAINFLESLIFRNRSVSGVLLSAILFVMGLVVVYIRSGRVLSDDINSLKTWNKKLKK